jgi:hypothetical protein
MVSINVKGDCVPYFLLELVTNFKAHLKICLFFTILTIISYELELFSKISSQFSVMRYSKNAANSNFIYNSGVMVSMQAMWKVDHGFEPQLG